MNGVSYEAQVLLDCRPELKPYVGQEFETLDEGISFYEAYANDCRFDTHRFGHKFYDGVKTWQTIVCSRQGEKFCVEFLVTQKILAIDDLKKDLDTVHYDPSEEPSSSAAQSNDDDIVALFDGMEELSQKLFRGYSTFSALPWDWKQNCISEPNVRRCARNCGREKLGHLDARNLMLFVLLVIGSHVQHVIHLPRIICLEGRSHVDIITHVGLEPFSVSVEQCKEHGLAIPPLQNLQNPDTNSLKTNRH
ncbi:hypothetical protein SASPL_137997 [Salvia splendens]|uniref:Uncharacterized protein n=1 Tax=Salvia splendens TaxID=180675 RepID=A0A8X8WUH4_SALSN|nr:hypothetical protein SASPL_137997 [Salvia splendens]